MSTNSSPVKVGELPALAASYDPRRLPAPVGHLANSSDTFSPQNQDQNQRQNQGQNQGTGA
jgi:hypothetical protein